MAKKKTIPKVLDFEMGLSVTLPEQGTIATSLYGSTVPYYDSKNGLLHVSGNIFNQTQSGFIYAGTTNLSLPYEVEVRPIGRPNKKARNVAMYLFSKFLTKNGRKQAEANAILKAAFGFFHSDSRNIERCRAAIKDKVIQHEICQIMQGELTGGRCIGFTDIENAEYTENRLCVTGNCWEWRYPETTARYHEGITLTLMDKDGEEIKWMCSNEVIEQFLKVNRQKISR